MNVLKNGSKKLISSVLSLILAIEIVPFSAFITANAETETVRTEATGFGQVEIDGAHINADQKLKANPDGTYTFTLTLSSDSKTEDESVDSKKARSGYLVAKKTGQYLIEAFGSNGSDGQDTDFSAGGAGGEGGRVYGVISLNEGDVLYYNIGGNGGMSASSGEGGGYQGGAGHGGAGSKKTGGGGGYTAVYLFSGSDADYFKSTYLDADGKVVYDDVLETDRVTKYIMIAGGGGGGGAGNSWQAKTPSFLYDPFVGTADGGAAGIVGKSDSVILSGDGYAVNGTVYFGSNGKSSGEKQNYIGKGGTTVPGATSETWGQNFKGTQANDWEASYNKNVPGGEGGAGNLRGGAGGAGYCGGSGGSMVDLIRAASVGGGGGGSSFIASSVESLDEYPELASFLSDGNKSETGGCVYITTIPEGGDFSFMENFTMSFKHSEYMMIDSASAVITSSDGVDRNALITVDSTDEGTEEDDDRLHSIHCPLMPGRDTVTVEITLETIWPFAGGNGVPVVDLITFDASEKGAQTLAINDDVKYVNVPLGTFGVISKQIKTNVSPFNFNANDLYEKKFAGLDFSDPDVQRCYEFIDNDRFRNKAEQYSVYEEDPATHERTVNVTGQDLSIDETTIYLVSYTVYPKQDKIAVVGEPIPAEVTYSGTAVAYVDISTSVSLGGKTVVYTKRLDYLDDSYLLSLNVVTSTAADKKSHENIPEFFAQDVSEATYTVPESGYYLIRAWGGNGADGENKDKYTGGKGGKGGYIDGIIHLDAGETIYTTLALNGENNKERHSGKLGDGGGGGGYTAVFYGGKKEADAILIAGGGAGGNGADNSGIKDNGANGKDCRTYVYEYALSPYSLIDPTLGDFAGNNGYYGSAVPQDGGYLLRVASKVTAPESSDYSAIASSIMAKSTYTNNKPSTPIDADTSQYVYGGAVKINCVALDDTSVSGDLEKEALEGFAVDTTLAKDAESLAPYFNVDSVYLNSGSTMFTASSEDADGGSYTLANDGKGASEGHVKVTNINAPISENESEDGLSIIFSVDFTVCIELVPKDGFLGGNDVPLLPEGGMVLSQGADSVSVKKANHTDYVNVQIPEALTSGMLVGNDRTYYIGNNAINTTDLYTFTGSSVITVDPTAKWKSKFVNFEEPHVMLKNTDDEVSSATLSPLTKTNYKIVAAIRPKAEAKLAPIIHDISDNEIHAFASIDVRYLVEYDLTNLTTSDTENDDGVYSVPLGEDYTVVLSPESGWKLPEGVEVTIGGVKVSKHDYSYDKVTGELSIPDELITGNVVITASADVVTYTLTYTWQISPYISLTGSASVSMPAGTDGDEFASKLQSLLNNHVVDPLNVPDGFTYVIDYSTDDGQPLTKMPASNYWIEGRYEANEYTLHIDYVDGDGNPVIDAYEDNYFFEDDFSVESPTVNGYVPVSASVVSGEGVDLTKSASGVSVVGTFGAGDITVTVVYEKAEGTLNVIYINSQTGEEAFNKVNATITEGTPVSYVSPALTGFTPSVATVSLTPTASDVENGKVVYVYYTPNRHVISFDFGNGNDPTERYAYYNEKLGYTAEEYDDLEYLAFPTASKLGYTFLGWYNGESKVAETDVLSVDDDMTLVAKYDAVTVTVTVKFVFRSGEKAADDMSDVFEVGETYAFDGFDDIDGYHPEVTSVTGTTPAQNRVVTVKYIGNDYTLTLVLYDSKTKTTLGSVDAGEFEYMTDYSVSVSELAPEIYARYVDDGYTVSPGETVKGTLDFIGGKTVTVYFAKDAVVSVSVAFGEMEFDYAEARWDTEELNYYIPPREGTSNAVTVTNEEVSELPVKAEIYFDKSENDVFVKVEGYFTDDEDGEGTRHEDVKKELAPEEDVTAYLWLKGTLIRKSENDGLDTVGTCTVKLSKGVE